MLLHINTMSTETASDAAVARMLTAVAEVELSRKLRQEEEYRTNKSFELEQHLRDIKRQYEGATTALAVALKQTSSRLKGHDDEYSHLKRRQAEFKKSRLGDLSKYKQDLLSQVQALNASQLASFEHMRYNHRKALDALERSPPSKQKQVTSSPALLLSRGPTRPAPRTPLRMRYNGRSGNIMVSPVTDAQAQAALASRAHAAGDFRKQRHQVRNKWQAKIDGFKSRRLQATKHKDRRHRGGHGSGATSSSETDDSVAEDPEAVLARLQERVRSARRQQKNISVDKQAPHSDKSHKSSIATEAATPSFDSFLFSGQKPTTKTDANAAKDQNNVRPADSRQRPNNNTHNATTQNHTTNPFESDSDDFVVDDSFQPMPSPQARPTNSATTSEVVANSHEPSQDFDDKLWEIAGLGRRVPPAMRNQHGNRSGHSQNAFESRAEDILESSDAGEFSSSLEDDISFGKSDGQSDDPLLKEMEAQLKALEAGARQRQARWASGRRQ